MVDTGGGSSGSGSNLILVPDRNDGPVQIELIRAGDASPAVINGLAEVLLDAVAGGASVGFLASLTEQQARAWWRGALQDPGLLTWVARDGDRIVGTVGLVASSYPTGAHRAEVTKFLVHRDARGRGQARALMDALERTAAATGRSLLLLDTETGSHAESVYRRWGWQSYGIVDDHAAAPDGHLTPTTFMSKRL
jgi:GNAT superfamily N-acetyltransferase